jgi:glutathione S-transferase
MLLTLYYSPLTCAMASWIALTEAGADFTVRVVDQKRGGQMEPEFLRLNPKHRVPVLLIDGEPLTENVAIQLWVARHYPAARLLPEADLDQARAVALLAWCASGIHPCLTPNARPQRYCDLPESEDSVRRCAQKLLRESYGVAEGLLQGRDWFFDRFTLPDSYFFWCFRRGGQFKVDQSDFPACQRHCARVAQRPSVQKLLAFEAASMAALEGA